jgi:uncharacterized membrane protein YfhO
VILIDKWFDCLDDKIHHKKVYFVVYTFVFLMVALGIFWWFIRETRSFIWQPDGQQQHFNALMYYGTYLRNIGRQLLRGHLDIPLWDFSFGFGADIPPTLHHYVFGDPLALLSAFVPTRYTEYLYNSLVLFRLYLAGITYSLYCFKFRKEPWTVLIGALIYAFCGYTLFALRHPFFLNPLIYLPLLCIGVEQLFKKEKPYFFIIMVFISLSSNFYFFYMLSILVVIYALIRFFFVHDNFSWVVLIKNLGKFIFYYLIGVLMAGVIAFPSINALFMSARRTISHDIPLFYPLERYQNFVFYFISNQSAGYWTQMGYASISVIAVLYLILFMEKKKEFVQLRIGFAILTTILFIPYLGHVMHGFSYIANRWIWGYSFLVAFIVTSLLPELIDVSKKRMSLISFFTVMYILALVMISNIRKMVSLPLGLMLLINLVILIVGSLFRVKNHFKYISLLVMTVVNLIVLGGFRNSPYVDNYVSEFQISGWAAPSLQQSPTRSVEHFVEDGFFRVEENHFHTEFVRNSSVQTRINSSSFYWSLANPYVGLFLDEIHHWRDYDAIQVGLDGRAMLGVLASNRYFIVREGHEGLIPYGYYKEPVSATEVFADDNRTHHAFLNAYTLPLGYTYNRYLTRRQYDQLSFVQRQQALMQAVLLEGPEISDDIPLIFNDQLLRYEVKLGSGITFDDQQIYVSEQDATLTLSFETIPNSEIYVNFNNIYFEGSANRSRIKLQNDDIRKEFHLSTPDNNFYVKRHHFALNMGYHEESTWMEVEISFGRRGTYTLDNIEVIAQPMDLFAEMVGHLNEYTLENISTSTNQIEGTIQLSKDRILVLSIPYSEGWRAYVNDELVELKRANTLFMAIELPEGDHQIRLVYWTPSLTEGMIATFIGFGLFSGVIAYFGDKKKSISKVING